MTRNVIFKTLVDVIFFIHLTGIFGLIFILPFGTTYINQAEHDVIDWEFNHWLLFILNLIANFLIVIALFYLRKMARFLLSKKYFSCKVIYNLKKAGNYLILSGLISLFTIICFFILNLYGGEFKIVYNSTTTFSLFILMVGLFFIIQSNALRLANQIDEESKLTI